MSRRIHSQLREWDAGLVMRSSGPAGAAFRSGPEFAKPRVAHVIRDAVSSGLIWFDPVQEQETNKGNQDGVEPKKR